MNPIQKQKLDAQDVINQKQAKVAQQQAAASTRSTQVSIPLYSNFSWINKEDKDNQLLNIEEFISKKASKIMFGKPVAIDGLQEYKMYALETNMQWHLRALEKMLFKHGNAFSIITKSKKGKLALQLADPTFPNKMVRINGVPYKALIWRLLKVNRAKYWIREEYTYDKIKRTGYTELGGDTEISIGRINEGLPKSLALKETETHNLGFLPVQEWHREPIWDYSTPETAKGLYKFHMQKLLDEHFRTLRLENQNNRTRIILDQQYVDKSNRGLMAKLAKSDILFQLDGTGSGKGDAKPYEMVKGDPKFSAYWESINNIIRMALEYSGYSDLADASAANPTATGAIFTKANDLETSNDLSKYRQDQIKAMLIKMDYIVKGIKMDEIDLNDADEDLIVTIKPNIIFNEMNLTDTLIKQRDAGWITNEKAISRIEGISIADAEIAIAEAEQQQEESLDEVIDKDIEATEVEKNDMTK